MTAVSIDDTPTITLGRFIKANRFFVPNHQRDFSWKKEIIIQFINDIEAAKDRSDNLYFCGLMVFTSAESNALKVLDGQQRLATTIMIYSAIRNWLGRYSDFKKDEVKIETQLLESDEISSRQSLPEPKISLTSPNNQYFQKYVIKSVPIADIEKALKNINPQDRSGNLLSAAITINKYVEATAQKFEDKEAAKNYFLDLIQYISDKVRVVRFIVQGADVAYTIFETLNDRGLDLAPLDLVKNYLFSRAEKYQTGALKDFEARWSEMMTLLGSLKADSFLRSFWISRHSATDSSKLFSVFKRIYDTPQKINMISEDLRSSVERYSALFDATDSLWLEYSPRAKRSIKGISVIDPSQIYPVILSAFEKFSKDEMTKLLRLIEVISVRYQLIGTGRPGRIESLGGKVAKQIWNGDITTVSDVRIALSELYKSDDEFRNSFRLKRETDSKKARYILLAINSQSMLQDGTTYHDEIDASETLTLEHIFPKSPKNYWEEASKSDPKLARCLTRLGNMCLLADANRALGNKPWPEKSEAFKKSILQVTNQVTTNKYPEWDSSAIEKRQAYMADLAVNAWKWP